MSFEKVKWVSKDCCFVDGKGVIILAVKHSLDEERMEKIVISKADLVAVAKEVSE